MPARNHEETTSYGLTNSEKYYDVSKNSPEASGLVNLAGELSDLGVCPKHARRVTGLMDLFSGTKTVDGRQVILTEEVYDAALLHDVYDALKVDSDSGAILREEFLKAARSWDQKDSDKALKTIALIRDLSVVEREVRGSDNSQPEGAYMAPKVDWFSESPDMDWDRLNSLINEVHYEALVIKSVETMDIVKDPTASEGVRFEAVRSAESFYIPTLEALGFSALAMELDSSCKILRLSSQGKKGIVERAAEIYRSAQNADPLILAKKVLGEEDLSQVKWIVQQTDEDIYEGINCRVAEMPYRTKDGKHVKVKFRQKSIGSLAEKIDRKGKGYEVMDVIGLRAVVGEGLKGGDVGQQKELADVFNVAFDNISSSSEVELSQTNPARKAYFVSGNPSFVDNLKRCGVGSKGGVDFDYKLNPDAYDVAKVTLKVGNCPLELQFGTSIQEIFDIEMGVNNHGLYGSCKRKENNSEEILKKERAIQILAQVAIKARKTYGEKGSKKVSVDKAEAALRMLVFGTFVKPE